MEHNDRSESHQDGEAERERTDPNPGVQEELLRILEETEELIHDQRSWGDGDADDDGDPMNAAFPDGFSPHEADDGDNAESPAGAATAFDPTARRMSLLGEVTREVCRDLADLSLFRPHAAGAGPEPPSRQGTIEPLLDAEEVSLPGAFEALPEPAPATALPSLVRMVQEISDAMHRLARDLGELWPDLDLPGELRELRRIVGPDGNATNRRE